LPLLQLGAPQWHQPYGLHSDLMSVPQSLVWLPVRYLVEVLLLSMSQAFRAIVTGGGGFLGSRIVGMLLAEGSGQELLAQRIPGTDGAGSPVLSGDLVNGQAVREAVEGSDVVFHVAAKAGIWGDYAEYHATNVVGTRNVIEACRRNHISKLVYTSTPSVVFRGHHVRNANEQEPYPEKHLAAYTATKAEAERLVIQANSRDLATVALRPHLG
jgi:nucleoside-diphosphate-sugar epimerase